MLKIVVPNIQEELNGLLYNIASNNNQIDEKNVIERFISIYKGDFRHQYSSLFTLITEIDKSSEYSLDILSERLEECINNYAVDDKIKEKLLKLKDHVNLEIARLNHYKSILASKDLLLERTDERIVSLDKKIEKMSKHIDDSSDSLKNQVTTILGIFASIVLSFAGGMTFTTSAFNSITSVGIRNTIILLLLLGMIFIIAVYSLTYVIAKINRIDLRVRWFYIVVFVMLILLFLIYYYLPLK